jgi:hypothetical protein
MPRTARTQPAARWRFQERKRPMPSLKEQLILYVKKLKKREASKEMRNDSANDGFRIEGMNIAYR